MALTDSQARSLFLASAPAMTSASPRVVQGLVAIARTLNNYGYRYEDQGETDHNWGAFLTPQGVPCAPPETHPVPLGGGDTICLISFPDDEQGVNTLISAASGNPAISDAFEKGDVTALADALLASSEFGRQASAMYTAGTLPLYLGMSIVAVAQAAGEQPDWFANGVRIDQAIAQANQGGTDTPAGGGVPAGGGTPTAGDEHKADEGMSLGKGLVVGAVLAAAGWGLYKAATRGPR